MPAVIIGKSYALDSVASYIYLTNNNAVTDNVHLQIAAGLRGSRYSLSVNRYGTSGATFRRE